MENATKAILISASVLIVIILISIGLSIYSASSKSSEQVVEVSSNVEVRKFNAQFEQYFGNSVSYSQTRKLVSQIMINNSNNPNHIVLVVLKNSSGNYITLSAHNATTVESLNEALQDIYDNYLKANKTYKIIPTISCAKTSTRSAYTTEGYLKCITISETT